MRTSIPCGCGGGEEGFSEILATFRSALDRMREFPDFTFTSACTAYYEWVEAVDPDMFEEIRQRYFREKFGTAAKTGYNVDFFGHNASIPMLLRLSGMENYIFMRPMPHENPALHDLFDWRSPDGSTVQLLEQIERDHMPEGAAYSTPAAYFDATRSLELPTVQGELQHHARGCYSANSRVKRANRATEYALLAAESLCALSDSLTG